MALVPPRYPLDSFEDYAKLIQDAGRGVAGALEAVKYYQALARGTETICRTHEMPVSICGHMHRPPSPYRVSASTVATYEMIADMTKKKELSQAPEGVHFATHKRVGDETRDRYLNHLGLMYADGFIDEPEYQARTDAAITMQTREELDALVQDLPKLPDREKAPAVEPPKPPVFLSLALFVACLANLFTVLNPVGWIFFLAATIIWGSLLGCALVTRFLR